MALWNYFVHKVNASAHVQVLLQTSYFQPQPCKFRKVPNDTAPQGKQLPASVYVIVHARSVKFNVTFILVYIKLSTLWLWLLCASWVARALTLSVTTVLRKPADFLATSVWHKLHQETGTHTSTSTKAGSQQKTLTYGYCITSIKLLYGYCITSTCSNVRQTILQQCDKEAGPLLHTLPAIPCEYHPAHGGRIPLPLGERKGRVESKFRGGWREMQGEAELD